MTSQLHVKVTSPPVVYCTVRLVGLAYPNRGTSCGLGNLTLGAITNLIPQFRVLSVEPAH